MDAFEQVVGDILWRQGYRVRTSVQVNLTKKEKRIIGRHTAPRWELDIVACSGRGNLLHVVECKSYIDSVGVRATAFDGTDPDDAKRYKLFNEPGLRGVVFDRLLTQLTECGACRTDAEIRLCLACGKIREEGRAKLREHFTAQGWDLWDEHWLADHLR